MRKNNINNFYDKIILDDSIYFESEILKYMTPKYIDLTKLEFYTEPKFIEIKDVKIVIENKMFNQKLFYKKMIHGAITIEPVLIKNPNILETYYHKKNIKFNFIENSNSEDLIDIVNKEKIDILRLQLKMNKDEINTL